MASFPVVSFGHLHASMHFASDKDYDSCKGWIVVLNEDGGVYDHIEFSNQTRLDYAIVRALQACTELATELARKQMAYAKKNGYPT